MCGDYIPIALECSLWESRWGAEKLSNWIFKLLECAWLTTAQFTTEGWLSHHTSKSKPTKTMQWNAFGDKKTNDQCDSRDDTQRKIQRWGSFHSEDSNDPTDMPFEFKRIQFPIRLAFTMTINKSQGQSLSVCGLNLENACFSHGQLYVACSRVGKPSALFVLAPDNKTKNVVYHKVLH